MKLIDELRIDVGYMVTAERTPEWKAWVLAIVGYVRDLSRSITCKIFGHKWASDDYGNPESGYAGATCERCGYWFGNYLY